MWTNLGAPVIFSSIGRKNYFIIGYHTLYPPLQLFLKLTVSLLLAKLQTPDMSDLHMSKFRFAYM